jgi:hypothetical protein
MLRQILTATTLLGIFLFHPVHPAVVCAQPDFETIGPDDRFPDGISPTHVFAQLDLLDRSLDQLLQQANIVIPDSSYPQLIESDLLPMHVYQCILICTWRLQTLDDLPDYNVKHIPTISANPRIYDPRDVFFLVDMMLDNVRQIGVKLNLELPGKIATFSDKTPLDVFNLGTRVFIKINRLSGFDKITPSEVFAQLVRGVEDAKSILRQSDPACRYRIDAPPTEPERSPADVFAKCLEIRHRINTIRRTLDLESVPVPELPENMTLEPRDVFFQTQIIIAELNLLKQPLATNSSSPLAIPVTAKTPTHAHQQASMILYLLQQVKPSK